LKTRGQLQIAEVLVAATILMVFILSIITFATNITPPPDKNWEELRDKGYFILETADKKDLLRPAVYDYENDPVLINDLAAFIRLNLPEYADFAISRAEIKNKTTVTNKLILYSSGVDKSNQDDIININYLLTEYYNAGKSSNTHFIVTLAIWRKI